MRRYRELFLTLEAAAEILRQVDADDLEQSIDAGIALGLAADPRATAEMLDRYIRWFESGESSEWRADDDEKLYERVRTLGGLAPDTSAFRAQLRGDVRVTRTALKLEADVELPF